MANLFEYNIPLIGTKGIYTLTAPFQTSPGEILECIAVRTISAYIANNDDPFTEVYKAAGLSEDVYEADLNDNVQIVTLVNDKGYRYLVPGRYIASYPVQDGIEYRPLTITVALPLIRVDANLDPVMSDIRDLIMARIGVNCSTSLVEMGSPRGFDRVRSDVVEVARELAATSAGTAYAQISQLEALVTDLRTKNQALEEFILENQ